MKSLNLLSASALAIACACFTPVAIAQDTPAADETVVDDSESNSIVVTGSRIRRTGIDTLEPAVVVSGTYLETRGLTNVADALNEIPGFGVGVTPEGGQSGFGVGQNFVNRFGLGSNRTLTLVNGRRYVGSNAATIFGPAAPGLQVDLNAIPSKLVDRIENVAIGGAPAYGSDAIAGTVNVILKKDFEGVLASATSGITARGDNFRLNTSLVAGTNFSEGRGNITVALTYDRSDGVLATQRPRYAESIVTGTNPLAGSASANLPGRTPANDGRVNPNIPFNTGSTDGIPNSVFLRNGRIFSLTPGGLLLPATGANTIASGLPRGFGAANTLIQFDTAGNLVPYDPGTPFGVQNASGGQGLLLNETVSLLADLKRFSANSLGRYEFSPAFTAFFEASYYRAEALEIADQSIYNGTLFGSLSAPLTFSASDPRLTDQARTTLAGLGVTDFRLSRASRDLVSNRANSIQETYRLVGGFEGEFNVGERAFYWEASANYGESKGTFFATVLNQQNFVNAMNVTTNAAGQIVCDPNPVRNVAPGSVRPVVDAACVPLNVFGEGVASPESLAYVTDRTRTEATQIQKVFNINIGGSPFDLWAGPVNFVLGYEHRDEKGDFNPDAFQRAGLGRSAIISANGGQYNTDEVFGELEIPLVSPSNNFPLVYRLTAEGKGRYVDNTVNGGFFTYTVGGRYQPVRDVTFRGNYTKSLRAPALVELFTPISPIFSFFNDPCDSINVGSGPNPAARARNCAAFYSDYGITPGTFSSVARSASQPATLGGDPNLDNEVAKAYTFGVVVQPSFIPRLRVAVDWNRIKIDGPIVNLAQADIASGCYDNENFDASNVDSANQFCRLFTRVRSADPAQNGQLVSDPANPGLRTGYVNGAFISLKGLSAEFNYNFPLDFLGMSGSRIDLAGSLFYLHDHEQSANGVTIDPIAGEIGSSKYTGQFSVGYSDGTYGLDFQGNYTGKAKFNILNTVETQDILSVKDQWIFNAGFSARIKDDTVFRITVTNLFDTQPPFPVNGAGTYDTLLRRFAVSMDYRF